MSCEKIKILFVCMGNICRSPTAEGAFKWQLKKHNVEYLFEVDSAGTHAYYIGSSPDARSQLAAKKYDVDLSNQRGRQVDESDFYYYDYIICMDSTNLFDLQLICPKEYQYKLSLMLNNIPNDNEKNVPDPYFYGRFDEVFKILRDASGFLLQKLLKKV